MRLRNDQNAVSITTALVAFLLVGCMIAAYALWAGCEAAEVKGGLIAYACIAGPLFLAAALSTRGPSAKHRSFRTTTPPYMEGRRVKRRLLAITSVSSILVLAAALGTAAFVLTVIVQMGAAHRIGIFGRPLLVLSGAIGAYLTSFALRAIFVSFGWMTPEEAKSFPLRGWWPESWLEPLDEGEPKERSDSWRQF